MVKTIAMEDFYQKYPLTNAVLLDVREPDEFAAGHVVGVRNFPLSQLSTRLAELDQATPYYVICRSGRHSANACGVLEVQGFDATNVAGGMLAWPGKVEKD